MKKFPTRQMAKKRISLFLPCANLAIEYKLIQDLIAYTNKNKGNQDINFGGTTNGVLYSPDKVEWLLKNRALMLVSLDGPEHIHDKHRCFHNGKGSWKIIDKNVREALKIAPQQMVRASLSIHSAPYFLDTIKYFIEDLDIKDFSFSPVFEDKWDKESLSILEDQFSKAIDYIVQRRKDEKPIAIKHFDDEANIPKDTDFLPIVNPCGAGNNYSGWSIDGVNYPCHRFNKHEQTFEQRIESPMALGYLNEKNEYIKLNQTFADSFLNFKDNASDTCKECDIYRKSVCNGGCYAMNYDMTKDIHGIYEVQCKFNKIQRAAGILYATKLLEAGLELPKKFNGISKNQDSCVCFNMCYAENSEYEIIHSTNQTDMTCNCYNANYNNPQTNEQLITRTLKERQAQKEGILEALKTLTVDKESELVTKAFEILNTLK